jgi:hypothetical protein
MRGSQRSRGDTEEGKPTTWKKLAISAECKSNAIKSRSQWGTLGKEKVSSFSL